MSARSWSLSLYPRSFNGREAIREVGGGGGAFNYQLLYFIIYFYFLISFSYLRLFGESINHALQVSLGSGSKKDSHVFKISVVRGK